MKKIIYFLLLLSLIIVSCDFGNDDGQQEPPVQSTIRPDIRVEFDEILNRPPGSDITDLVDFGQENGISSSDFTVELQFGQELVLDQPTVGVGLNQGILYSRLAFFEENPGNPGVFDIPVDTLNLYGSLFDKSVADPGSSNSVEFPDDDDRSLSSFLNLEVIGQDNTEDLEYKYEIEVAILDDGNVIGYYVIDPKLIIRAND
ncbi:hypothetical protein [Winogradskyella alexanderae]|uniref:Lipoprotein n=1 Tax=Winogradskyella alexanderae TaxID=2877123 RepID=A0ABS7XNP8_9FLAO|nr:hypothetical protein [Winogradskyella alexanderae]MCA0131629.1 hypothetical protein [Winogradskyella alexanderae]